jgi:hypothetical protein
MIPLNRRKGQRRAREEKRHAIVIPVTLPLKIALDAARAARLAAKVRPTEYRR